MTALNMAEILEGHVTLEVTSVDRLYLNLYVPWLQQPGGVYQFMKAVRGLPLPSPAILGQIGTEYVRQVERFAHEQGVPLEPFPKDVRKEDYVRPLFQKAIAQGRTGVVFIGIAQERAHSFRGVRAPEAKADKRPWFRFMPSTVCVKWFYFYILDPEFGPSFLKMCTYMPFAGRVYLNGHEWAKRQLQRAGVGFCELDNGFLATDDPDRLQAECDRFGPAAITDYVRRWSTVLPWPFTPEDRQGGCEHAISLIQTEVSLTQVFDQPRLGRRFFEQAIHDHLDLGRPEEMSLIFDRKITRRTPGKFATRIIHDGVLPSIHARYKDCGIKQYFKEGRALRTETTVNNTYDLGINRGVQNLPAVIAFGRATNLRLLAHEQTSANCLTGASALAQTFVASDHDGQRASGLPFGQPRAMALESAICLLALGALHPTGFRARDLRPAMHGLLGAQPYTPANATYDLRRLRLKGIIVRVPQSHRYRVTPEGLRICLAVTKLYQRVLAPAVSQYHGEPMTAAINRTGLAVDRHLAALAAIA
ncbi:MAG: hypothetical protein ACP5QO_16015 [Clostridia bacterium]